MLNCRFSSFVVARRLKVGLQADGLITSAKQSVRRWTICQLRSQRSWLRAETSPLPSCLFLASETSVLLQRACSFHFYVFYCKTVSVFVPFISQEVSYTVIGDATRCQYGLFTIRSGDWPITSLSEALFLPYLSMQMTSQCQCQCQFVNF